MTDRRQTPDRRLLPTRQNGSGRRTTDHEPAHGTRARYGRGCKCATCRSANAAYESEYRRLKREGKRLLGTIVSPISVRRKIRELKIERVAQAAISRALGLKNRSLRLHPDGITVRKLARIKRVFDAYMAEGPELPPDAADGQADPLRC